MAKRPADYNAAESIDAATHADPYMRPAFSSANRLKRMVWNVAWLVLCRWTPRPLHGWRAMVLRMFGAAVGPDVHVYPGAKIWAPWNLTCEANASFADGAEIYNPAPMFFGSHAIVSQGAYVCGATHDLDDAAFPLLAYAMRFGAYTWICAKACVGPGVDMAEGAVLGLGSVATKSLEAWTVYAGSPAVAGAGAAAGAGVRPTHRKLRDGWGTHLLPVDYAGGMKSLLMIFMLLCGVARGVELRVSAPALERSMARQLFNQAGPDGKKTRHYLRGSAERGCSVYADEPHVSFRDAVAPEMEARIVVTVKTHAKIGFGKSCFGISVTAESTVSFIPEAEGESIGFRDARVEKLSNNKELDLLLEPFLAKRMPQEMKVNAADMLRTLMVKAPDQTGYALTLTSLELRSMHVQGDALMVDLDAAIRVD